MSAAPTGTIAIEGIDVYGYHGVYRREQELGTRFVVDVYLEAPITEAAGSDALPHTVDYFQVYQLVLDLMGDRAQLLETLTVRIGEEILRRFAAVQAARVRVSKLRPLAMDHCQRTYVELAFRR